MSKIVRIFLLVGVAMAPLACGDSVCVEANDLCAATPDGPSFAAERDRCVGDDECVSTCLVDANACEAADVSGCEARCEGSAGGGAP